MSWVTALFLIISTISGFFYSIPTQEVPKVPAVPTPATSSAVTSPHTHSTTVTSTSNAPAVSAPVYVPPPQKTSAPTAAPDNSSCFAQIWPYGAYTGTPAGADAATYVKLGSTGYYSKDSVHVYAQSTVICGADPSTFTVLHDTGTGDTYAKDKNTAYADNIAIAYSEPQTFSLIMDSKENFTNYTKDKKNVYFHGAWAYPADPATFQVLSDPRGYATLFAADKSTVFYQGNDIRGADPSTFTVIIAPNSHGTPYAKDKNALYYEGSPVQNHFSDMVNGNVSSDSLQLDVASFTILFNNSGDITGYAKDTYRVYHIYTAGSAQYLSVVQGADSSSFSIIDPSGQCGVNCIYDAQDRTHKYFNGDIVQ